MFMFTFVWPTEKPTIEIFSDQEDNTYFVGEDVIIKAELKNVSNILCVGWQTETPNGYQAIDISQSKYKGTKTTAEETSLYIRDCVDKETYFLLAACDDGSEICSNKICLNVVKGESGLDVNLKRALFLRCYMLFFQKEKISMYMYVLLTSECDISYFSIQ